MKLVKKKNPVSSQDYKKFVVEQVNNYSTLNLTNFEKAEWENCLSSAAAQVDIPLDNEAHVDEFISWETYNSS